MRSYILSLSKPASSKVTCFHYAPLYGCGKIHMAKWAADTIKGYAARSGVAASAIDWTCRPAKAA